MLLPDISPLMGEGQDTIFTCFPSLESGSESRHGAEQFVFMAFILWKMTEIGSFPHLLPPIGSTSHSCKDTEGK